MDMGFGQFDHFVRASLRYTIWTMEEDE